jgi:hypothetical protein
LLNSPTYKFSDKALDELAKSTASWSGADITSVVANARSIMISTLAYELGQETDPKKKAEIDKEMEAKTIRPDVLTIAVRNHVPANSTDSIKEMHAWSYGNIMDKEEEEVLDKIYNFVTRRLAPV